MEWDESTLTLKVLFEGDTNVPKTGTNVESAVNVFVCSGFTKIESQCFKSYKSMKYLTLPDTIESLGNNFLIGTSIISLNIPLKVSEIDIEQPFDNQYTLERFIVKKEHEYLTTFDDSLYSKDMKTLYYYPGGKKDKVFFIPEGVENIFVAATAFSKYLEEIVIPPSVKKIWKTFGYVLNALKKVTVISCDNDIEWDKSYLFEGTNYTFDRIEWKKQDYLYSLTNSSSHLSVFVNDKCCSNSLLVSYNDTRFKGNNEIKSITFGRGITSIEGDCFQGSEKLSKVSFPETIEKIDANAFSNCKSLKKYSSIYYPQSILPVLRTRFNSYVLGLMKNTCHLNRRGNNIISIIY